MIFRDLSEEQKQNLMDSCYDDFKHWSVATNGGVEFGSQKKLENEAVFRAGFSKGVQALLRLVTKLEFVP